MVKSSNVDKVKDSSVRAVRLRHCNYGIDYTLYQIGKFVKCAGEIEFWSKLCAGNFKSFRGQLRFAG